MLRRFIGALSRVCVSVRVCAVSVSVGLSLSLSGRAISKCDRPGSGREQGVVVFVFAIVFRFVCVYDSAPGTPLITTTVNKWKEPSLTTKRYSVDE